MAKSYYGSSSDSGRYVDAGASGRVQYADNRFAEAYVVRDGQGDSEMYARITDSSNQLLRTIEVKEDSDYNYDPAVAALGSSGKFVVAWTNSDDDDAATDTHVLARVYSNDGSKASTILAVSGNGDQHADEASVAGLSETKFVIAYENDTDHTLHTAIFTQAATGSWSERDTVIDRSVGSNGGNPTVERVSTTAFTVHYTDANGAQTDFHGSTSGSVATAGLLDGSEHNMLANLTDHLAQFATII